MKKNTSQTYTIKKIKGSQITPQLSRFIAHGAASCNVMYGNKFRWEKFPLKEFADIHYLAICYRGKEPVGFMAATLSASIFDPDIIIFRQLLLYAIPGTRAAKYLLDHFIDFGQTNANHTISVIGQFSNVKPRSLERLGFTKLEAQYRKES